MFDLWKKLDKNKTDSIYLLYGKEKLLLEETKQKIISSVLLAEDLEFNLSVYDLEETPVEAALQDAETLPFLGERKVVIMQQPTFLTSEKAKGKVEHDLARLEMYINEPSEYAVLIFLSQAEKLDERKKLTKLLKKQAEIFEAKNLSDHERRKWIVDRVKEQKVQIEEDATEELLLLAGTDLLQLRNELDKLCLYAQSTNVITKETVEKLASRSLEQNIFSLVDKVVSAQIEAALRIYYDLLKQNEEPLKILAIIANQVRLIALTKELSQKGYGQQQIATTLKVHPFRIKLAAGQATYFSKEELNTIIGWLAEADLQLKTSAFQKEMVIEMLLFKIHHLKRSIV